MDDDFYKESSDSEDLIKERRIEEITTKHTKTERINENDYEEALELIELIPFFVNNIIENTNLTEAINKLHDYTSHITFEVTSVFNNFDFLKALCFYIETDTEGLTDQILDILSNIWSCPTVSDTIYTEPYAAQHLLTRFDNIYTTYETKRNILSSLSNMFKISIEIRDGLLQENIMERMNIYYQIQHNEDDSILIYKILNNITKFGFNDNVCYELMQFIPHIINDMNNDSTSLIVREESISFLLKCLETDILFEMCSSLNLHKLLIDVYKKNQLKNDILIAQCILIFINKGYLRIFHTKSFLISMNCHIEIASNSSLAYDVSSSLLIAWLLTDKYWEKMEEIGIYDTDIKLISSLIFNNKLGSLKLLVKYLNLCENQSFAQIIMEQDIILQTMLETCDSFDEFVMLDFIGVLQRMVSIFGTIAIDRLLELDAPSILESDSIPESDEISEAIERLRLSFIGEQNEQ